MSTVRSILSEDSHARRDLNLLADLVGGGSGSGGEFKLNLFPETRIAAGGGDGDGLGSAADGGSSVQTIVIDGSGRKGIEGANRDLMAAMADFNVDAGGGASYAQDDDDLLGLMDAARSDER